MLKGITLKISGGEKVGVVGRTGSGKINNQQKLIYYCSYLLSNIVANSTVQFMLCLEDRVRVWLLQG